MKFCDTCCPNKTCEDFGKGRCGNVVLFGTYRSKNGPRQRYQCQTCGRTFSERRATIFYGLHTNEQKVFEALAALAKKRSTKSVARALKIKLETLHRWLHKASSRPQIVGEILLQEFKLTQRQVDSLWEFIRKSSLGLLLFCLFGNPLHHFEIF